MSKKRKIVVSITGIVIVVLALLGLTYAYFVTTIQGNENDKSIEVTTANLKLVYRDGNGSITANNIMPGTEISSKEFTVTNEGNAESSYITVFENVLYTDTKTDPVTQINSFSRQEDLKYTLTCKQYNSSDVETGTCDGVENVTFPNATTMSLIVSNKIPVGYVHKYVLTLNYIEAGVDQSEDMGKSLSAKVNIKDVRMSNPYATIGGTAENSVEEANDTLAYNIINNAKLNKNGTSLVNVPLTKPAEEVTSFKYIKALDPATYTNTRSGATNYYITYANDYSIDETTGKFTLIDPSATTKYSDIADKTTLLGKYVVNVSTTSSSAQSTNNLSSIYQISKTSSDVTASSFKYATVSKEYKSTEKELLVTSDDYGTSYYFRGGVEDNYVNFAGMCWRVVRIEGDGSTKLILEDSSHECNSSEYTGNWTIGNTIAFGYDGNNRADFLNYTGGLADNLSTYQSTLTTKISDKYSGKTITDYLKADEWCYDDTVTETDQEGNEYYGAHTRIYTDKKPSLKCSGTKLISFKDNTPMYVGTLTADEISFAGGGSFVNYSYYLLNSYAKTNYVNWWALSPDYFNVGGGVDFAFIVDDVGGLLNVGVGDDCSYVARGAVSLSSSVEILTGDGTKNNPYTLK